MVFKCTGVPPGDTVHARCTDPLELGPILPTGPKPELLSEAIRSQYAWLLLCTNKAYRDRITSL